MPKTKDQILLTQQGFHFGHTLKDGSLSRTARRITEEEITTMFAHMLSTYCAKTGRDSLTIQAADGITITATMTQQNEH